MDTSFLLNKTSNTFKLIILTTCWNIEKYAEKYIKSLINQTHINFMAYINDDLSSDNTFNILSNLTRLDKRFIIIKNSEKKYKTKNFIDTLKK